MHQFFREPPRRKTGALVYPQLAFLRRFYTRSLNDVRAYYRRNPKRVDSDNLLGRILMHIPRRWDLDDERYRRFVEDASVGVARAFNITSSTYRGRVHEAGVSLGPQTDEILIASEGNTDLKRADREWKDWAPFTFLYHTRTDLGMPVPNNKLPGKGWGVSVIDIPLLAIQYRYWLKAKAEQYDQPESVFRFIGSFVLPNSLASYLDIAVFNRVARLSRGIGMPKYPTPHPFYLADYSGRVDRFGKWLLDSQAWRDVDIEQIPYRTPMLIKENLYQVMELPKDPVSRHNDWALQIARLPYMRYILETGVKQHKGDRTYLNNLYTSLVDASNDSIFSGVGSPAVVKQYRKEIRDLIDHLDSKGHGWG